MPPKIPASGADEERVAQAVIGDRTGGTDALSGAHDVIAAGLGKEQLGIYLGARARSIQSGGSVRFGAAGAGWPSVTTSW